MIPEPERAQVIAILDVYQDVSDAADKLRPLLNAHAALLSQNGFVTDYLAYKLPFEVYRNFERQQLGAADEPSHN